MTTQKHLKKLIRTRMARTGERYTVARAHVLAGASPPDAGWELRGGLDAEAAAFANVLANLGVSAHERGEPLDEALVVGVGGGLGAGYILWEFAHRHGRVVTLGFRNQWQYPAHWAAKTAERLGLHADIHETRGTRAAAEQLEDALGRGLPAIAWIDSYRLGHRHLPDWLDGRGTGPVVVYGADDGHVLVDDRSTGRASVPREALADARARVPSYRNRLITIDPAHVEIDADRLRAAVRAGLDDQVEHLSASSDSFSLPAWRKWARLATDTRNGKAWPNVFADRRGLASPFASIYENAGNGGNLRGLYADFLEQAAALLDEPPLAAAAPAFRTAAAAWDALVDTALPSAELRRLIDASNRAIAAGDSASAEAARLAGERWRLQEQLDQEPLVSAAELPELLARVGSRVADVYETETDALAALGRALAPG